MDPDESAICEFLKPWPGEYVAAQQICRQADGRRRFESDPKWALVPLTRLVENRVLETDGSGRYRLPTGSAPEKKPKRWISPQIKEILQSQGKLPDPQTGD
jgi:hypothetical protein